MGSNSKKPLIIYWSPSRPEESWDLFYPYPNNLYQELLQKRDPRSGRESFLNCPTVNSRLKSTFVFKNSCHSEFSYDFTNPDNPNVTFVKGIYAEAYKPSGIYGGAYVSIALRWLFFAEEEVTIMTNSPMFHEPTDIVKQGMVPSGRYDPSKWFRPLSYEIQMYHEKGYVTINEGDPLFYLEVLTDRPIIMKRFAVNQKLAEYHRHCTNALHHFGVLRPLTEKYQQFKASHMDKMVLQEIKNTLVEE